MSPSHSLSPQFWLDEGEVKVKLRKRQPFLASYPGHPRAQLAPLAMVRWAGRISIGGDATASGAAASSKTPKFSTKKEYARTPREINPNVIESSIQEGK